MKETSDDSQKRHERYERSKFGVQKRKRTGEWVECQTCGRVFYASPARIRQVAKKGMNIRFCTKSCYAIGARGEGNPFWGKRHSEETKTRFRENPDRNRFVPGPKNPNTQRFGPDFVGTSRNWWRENLKRRGRCDRCGYDTYPGILQMHHRDRNPKNQATDNLELLCPNCHEIDHLAAGDGRYSGYPATDRPEGWTPIMKRDK